MKYTNRFGSWFLIIVLITNVGCKKDNVPVLSTVDITGITSTSAISGGIITDEGSSAVIGRGICLGLKANPTIEDNKTSDGTGIGSFTSNLLDLDSGTQYFIRAYATNSSGTGYGNSLSFTTLDPSSLENELIQKYITDNPSVPFQLKASGLYYSDLIIGLGAAPVTHDLAYIKYTGKFLNGIVIDTNVGRNDTLISPVNEGYLIPGFEEGITYMRVGGKAQFLVPSKLAYGSAGYYTIPGYTPILYEVDLVKLKKK
jgi:hypothetical protein